MVEQALTLIRAAFKLLGKKKQCFRRFLLQKEQETGRLETVFVHSGWHGRLI
jgi:hypothetical protein